MTKVRISPQAYGRLERELVTLRQMYSGPAAEGDTDKSKAAVQRAWRIRMQRIEDLLVNAVVRENRGDDGVERGMVIARCLT